MAEPVIPLTDRYAAVADDAKPPAASEPEMRNRLHDPVAQRSD